MFQAGITGRWLTRDTYRTCSFALINGGTGGLVWGYFIVWMGYLLVFASIAEMASMYVTAHSMTVQMTILTSANVVLPRRAANITGCPSLHLRLHKGSSVTSSVRITPFPSADTQI
jgi:hypothetical protein